MQGDQQRVVFDYSILKARCVSTSIAQRLLCLFRCLAGVLDKLALKVIGFSYLTFKENLYLRQYKKA